MFSVSLWSSNNALRVGYGRQDIHGSEQSFEKASLMAVALWMQPSDKSLDRLVLSLPRRLPGFTVMLWSGWVILRLYSGSWLHFLPYLFKPARSLFEYD